DLYDAEEVAVRVLQNDEVGAGPVPPRVAFRTGGDQAPDLPLPIVGVEIEMQPTPARARLRRVIERHIGRSSRRITKTDTTVVCRLSRYVAKRRLPERQHRVELAAADHD